MIRLKTLELKSPIIQSPMAGCTDLAFRLVAREYGMEFAFLEMVSSESLVRRNPNTFRLLKTAPEDRPLGAQLVGCNPAVMGEAAAILEGLGFDLVDINMGCPVPKIVSPGGGSALLIEPEKARAIMSEVVKNVKRAPVTVKMRKGYSDPSGDEAVRIARIAEDCGVTAVTVHGRTRAQGYTGQADWDAIGKVKRAVGIPVFGNGDVTDAGAARRLMETSACDGVMIGRGGLGNPWIYKEIERGMEGGSGGAEPTLEDRRQALLKHFKLEIETEGEITGLMKMRRIACWYFRNFPGVAEFRGKATRAASVAEMRGLILGFTGTGAPPSPETPRE
jgi:nifR3 family TIM-barrel protein